MEYNVNKSMEAQNKQDFEWTTPDKIKIWELCKKLEDRDKTILKLNKDIKNLTRKIKGLKYRNKELNNKNKELDKQVDFLMITIKLSEKLLSPPKMYGYDLSEAIQTRRGMNKMNENTKTAKEMFESLGYTNTKDEKDKKRYEKYFYDTGSLHEIWITKNEIYEIVKNMYQEKNIGTILSKELIKAILKQIEELEENNI